MANGERPPLRWFNLESFDEEAVAQLQSDSYQAMIPITGQIVYASGMCAPSGIPSFAAKCPYCGLYGTLGRCVGCGAPNRPVR